jgi:hypothetical protein
VAVEVVLLLLVLGVVEVLEPVGLEQVLHYP